MYGRDVGVCYEITKGAMYRENRHGEYISYSRKAQVPIDGKKGATMRPGK